VLLTVLQRPGGIRPRVAVCALALLGLPGCRAVRGNGDEFSEPGTPPPRVTAGDIARQLIDARSIDRAVEFLASDALRGRAAPSAGLDRAAAWVGTQLQRSGLDPAGQDGGYIQYAPGPDRGGSPLRVPNVIGLLPGSESAGGIVMLAARLDGPGVGPADEHGDSLYNDATGAAGVAVLVEVARALAALPDRPRRAILFAVFSGSEAGLTGAAWFVDHPTVPLHGMAALVDLVPLGAGRDAGLRVVGPGADTVAAVLARVDRQHRLGLSIDPRPSAAGAPVDAGPFARLGAPVAGVLGPSDPVAGTPSDEASSVDGDRLARVARLLFFGTRELATEGVLLPVTARRSPGLRRP
jgi:hypothetical protein